jgi:hypothetical protein
MTEIQLIQMSAAKLTIRFALQAYTSAPIIDYGNPSFSVSKPVGDWKEGCMYHEIQVEMNIHLENP